MSKRLGEQIDDYIKGDYASFHTPGHKGVGRLDIRADLTELPMLESLYSNTGAIAKTEKQLSRIYGSGTIISASGSSLCIQTMLAIATKAGDKIIAVRNLHSSAVGAMALLDLDPAWLYPETNTNTKLLTPITAQAVEAAIAANNDAVAVYITSPDYYGQYCDIKSIAAVCKRYNKKLLVDSAHGAHFRFLTEDLHPISLGATICCVSLHKTLPTLTGAALLCFSGEYTAEQAKHKMSIFASTSPSYLVMSSIDSLVDRCSTIATELAALVEACCAIKERSRLACLCKNTDPTRITANFAAAGYLPSEFESLLTKNKIAAEFIDDEYCVFIPTINNSKQQLARLEGFLANIALKEPLSLGDSYKYTPLKRVATLRQALLAAGNKRVVTDLASGSVAAQTLSVCPPGIPIVMPGEEIDRHTVEILKKHRIYDIGVL